MKISMTLSRYLVKHFLFNFFFLLLIFLGIVYLFDLVELMRRASKRDDVPLGLVLQMGILKLPEVGQVLLPFAVLFSAMFTFWQLTKRTELIVVRASGLSAWQFLAPIILCAFLIGVLQVTVINPLGALLISQYEKMENTYLEREDRLIALFREGLWLRESDETSPDAYKIFHIRKIEQPSWVMRDVTVLSFDSDNRLRERMDAATLRLNNKQWTFEDIHIHDSEGEKEQAETLYLPTSLTTDDIVESFSTPETISFWALPGFIQILEETGFDTAKLRVHFQTLLAQPLLFASMILLAAAVSLRPPRSGHHMSLIAVGAFAGFLIFFAASFLQALGASQQIPVFMAAWSTASVSFLLGLSVIMYFEDG